MAPGDARLSDVFKAITLGADLVLIGRLVDGGRLRLGLKRAEGLDEAVVNILERELSRTMALAGVANIADIKKVALHVTRETFRFSKL